MGSSATQTQVQCLFKGIVHSKWKCSNYLLTIVGFFRIVRVIENVVLRRDSINLLCLGDVLVSVCLRSNPPPPPMPHNKVSRRRCSLQAKDNVDKPADISIQGITGTPKFFLSNKMSHMKAILSTCTYLPSLQLWMESPLACTPSLTSKQTASYVCHFGFHYFLLIVLVTPFVICFPLFLRC